METNPSRAHLRRFSIFLALAAAALLLPRQASAFVCLWDGSSNTNWATAANWSNCNSTTPQSGDTVTINSGGNQPSISTAATVGQITLGAGATLTVANGGALDAVERPDRRRKLHGGLGRHAQLELRHDRRRRIGHDPGGRDPEPRRAAMGRCRGR